MNRRDIIIVIIFAVCFGLWLLYCYCVGAFGLIVSFAVAYRVVCVEPCL